MAGPRFLLGQTVATPGVLAALLQDEILSALGRHVRGDWGDLDPEDGRANEQALVTGARLFSAYRSRSGVKFWVITEADRSSTCLLLPEEY
jgi:hypothetical protein